MTTVGFIGSGYIGSTVAQAAAFLDAIGYGAVDAGPLAESWRQQPGTPVYGTPYSPFSDPAGTPASEAVIRAALGKASR